MPRDVEEKPVPAGAGAAAGSAPSAAAAGSAPPPAADLQVDAKTVSHWNQWERFKVLAQSSFPAEKSWDDDFDKRQAARVEKKLTYWDVTAEERRLSDLIARTKKLNDTGLLRKLFNQLNTPEPYTAVYYVPANLDLPSLRSWKHDKVNNTLTIEGTNEEHRRALQVVKATLQGFDKVAEAGFQATQAVRREPKAPVKTIMGSVLAFAMMPLYAPIVFLGGQAAEGARRIYKHLTNPDPRKRALAIVTLILAVAVAAAAAYFLAPLLIGLAPVLLAWLGAHLGGFAGIMPYILHGIGLAFAKMHLFAVSHLFIHSGGVPFLGKIGKALAYIFSLAAGIGVIALMSKGISRMISWFRREEKLGMTRRGTAWAKREFPEEALRANLSRRDSRHVVGGRHHAPPPEFPYNLAALRMLYSDLRNMVHEIPRQGMMSRLMMPTKKLWARLRGNPEPPENQRGKLEAALNRFRANPTQETTDALISAYCEFCNSKNEGAGIQLTPQDFVGGPALVEAVQTREAAAATRDYQTHHRAAAKDDGAAAAGDGGRAPRRPLPSPLDGFEQELAQAEARQAQGGHSPQARGRHLPREDGDGDGYASPAGAAFSGGMGSAMGYGHPAAPWPVPGAMPGSLAGARPSEFPGFGVGAASAGSRPGAGRGRGAEGSGAGGRAGDDAHAAPAPAAAAPAARAPVVTRIDEPDDFLAGLPPVSFPAPGGAGAAAVPPPPPPAPTPRRGSGGHG